MAVYKKVCKYCGSGYESDSRNQRYCSTDCCEKAQVVLKKKTKKRAVKRKEYDKNKEINRALSVAHNLCEKVFELFRIPRVCMCKELGLEGECSGQLS